MTPQEVRELRQRLGLTQYQLSQEVGVQPIEVSRWERGHRTPSGSALRLLQLLAGGKAARKS